MIIVKGRGVVQTHRVRVGLGAASIAVRISGVYRYSKCYGRIVRW